MCEFPPPPPLQTHHNSLLALRHLAAAGLEAMRPQQQQQHQQQEENLIAVVLAEGAALFSLLVPLLTPFFLPSLHILQQRTQKHIATATIPKQEKYATASTLYDGTKTTFSH